MNDKTNNSKTADLDAIRLGINGSGQRIWVVQVKTGPGRWFSHKFDSEAEAHNWVRWC